MAIRFQVTFDSRRPVHRHYDRRRIWLRDEEASKVTAIINPGVRDDRNLPHSTHDFGSPGRLPNRLTLSGVHSGVCASCGFRLRPRLLPAIPH